MPTKIFPGFYPTVVDNSFNTPSVSRFRAGLIGVANRGAFNTPTPVSSIQDFSNSFGTSNMYDSLSTPNWNGYLAAAMALVSDYSDGTVVVRIGEQYEAVGAILTTCSSGPVEPGGYQIQTVDSAKVAVGDYLKIALPGQASTVNSQVIAKSGNYLTLSDPLIGDYSVAGHQAELLVSKQPRAASSAEAFLYALTYEMNAVLGAQSTVVTGSKNSFELHVNHDLSPKDITTLTHSGSTATVNATNVLVNAGDTVHITNVLPVEYNGTFTVTSSTVSSFHYDMGSTPATNGAAVSGKTMQYAELAQGDLIKITSATANTTQEVLVKSVIPTSTGSTIKLYTSSVSSTGYQVLPLQDSYTDGAIYKASKSSGGNYVQTRVLHLVASSEGDWANSDGVKSNLVVHVGPGSIASTKKFLTYYNGQLVETLDNLTTDSTSDHYYPTYVNAHSTFIKVLTDSSNYPTGVILDIHPSNTLHGWNSVGSGGSVNHAAFGLGTEEGAAGYNGEEVSKDTWIGTIDPSTDLYTGLRSLKNNRNFRLNVIAIPGQTDPDVQQELVAVAAYINAEAILDADRTLKPRELADWRNAVGSFSLRSKIDDWHGALYSNWWTGPDPFTRDSRVFPPSVGVLRATARTFKNDKPWSAVAGEIRGYIDVATDLDYKTIAESSKDSSYYAQTNLVLSESGRIVIYGNKTLQTADSHLSEVHNAHLVNYVVANIGDTCRKYEFDPNDTTLHSQIEEAITAFLETVKSERGLSTKPEVAVVSDPNDTRGVQISVGIAPYSVAERFYLSLTVNQTSTTLNSVTQ